MNIEFDPRKSERNARERGLPFERVVDFDFGTARISQDQRRAYPEPRLVACGYIGARLHVLCFTPLDDGLRIISLRKANSREVRDHEQQTAND